MRLFLSSYRFGSHADVLLEMLGEESVVGVITNAKDYKSNIERNQSVKELFADFTEQGITPHEIDLRPFFPHPDLAEKEVSKYDFIWIAGGNTFVLRKALQLSGVDKVLQNRTKDEEFLYGGESAGAVIVTPSLKGVEFGDDPNVEIEGYPDEELWDGLGLVSYSIVPHYESDWEGADRMIETLEEEGIPYKTLTDTQVLIVNEDVEEILT